jgi:hypothetical protein
MHLTNAGAALVTQRVSGAIRDFIGLETAVGS